MHTSAPILILTLLSVVASTCLVACDQGPNAVDPSSAIDPIPPTGGLIPGTPIPLPGEPTSYGKTIVKISPARISAAASNSGLEGNFTTTYHRSTGLAVGLDLTFSGTAAKQTP